MFTSIHMDAKSFTIEINGYIPKMLLERLIIKKKRENILIAIKSQINSKYFLALIPESKWPNVLFSGEALGSIKEQ